MRYKGQEITLSNYEAIFFELSLDHQDEIRSALLDSLPIFPYLSRPAEDLHQIRLAMKEGVPVEMFSYSASVLKEIRLARQDKISVDFLTDWSFTGSKVPDSLTIALIKWMREGYFVEGLDPRLLSEEHIPVLDKAVRAGVPNLASYFTWVYAPSADRLGKAFDLGSASFLDPRYSDEQLDIFLRSPIVLKNKFFPVTAFLQVENLREWETILNSGISTPGTHELLTELATLDDGRFVYDDTKTARIWEAHVEGLDTYKMLDPMLSIGAINTLYISEVVQKKSKFGGVL